MIKINNKLVFSYNKPPIIIAEISGNHAGSKKRFLKLIQSACLNGADLIKIQTYEPDDITLNLKKNNFKIKNGIWKNKFLWDLYKDACTPYKWHKDAFRIAKKYKKILFSSPFSKRGVDYLEKLGVKIYKIASFEITDLNLVDYIGSKKKPIIISTGMSNFKEIKNAIKIIKKYHNKIIILHCVSNYPTKLEDTNLKRIKFLKKEFKEYLIGISDHTKNIYSSIASIPLDVVAIEKHYNIDDKKTPDSEFSIKPQLLKELKNASEKIFESLKKNKNSKILKKNIHYRRSIFAKKNIKKNHKLTRDDIITYRPSIGIGSENFFRILGKKINKNIGKNRPIFFKDLINK